MWMYKNVEIDDFYEFFSNLIDDNDEWLCDVVDNTLDECYEPWKFGSTTFYPSNIVKEVNEYLYEEVCREEKDRIIADWQYDIDHYVPAADETLYDFLNADFCFESIMNNVFWVEEEEENG